MTRWNFWADVFHSDSRSSILHWRPSVQMFAYENCFVQYLQANFCSQFIALNVILKIYILHSKKVTDPNLASFCK